MQELLKNYFGYDTFRPLQEEIIEHVIGGKDALVIMATGGGKSLCYQLPSLQFPGVTLVVSPLIALMKDQVDSLTVNGIPAAFINSTLSYEAIRQIESRLKKGEIKILYVAPERLAVSSFMDFLGSLYIGFIAIDEAHCISEWGHDFRPEYRNLSVLRKRFADVPLMALTATATDKVRIDIIEQLGLHRARVFISSFNRENLSYHVRPKKNAFDELLVLLKKYAGESVIIYCFSRKKTEELAARLREENFSALAYHAGLDAAKRKKTQEQFIHDEVSVIVATIAFGMGIDKPNVRLVVHADLPKSVESYYQETGRAGRDGLPSECVLFYSHGDRMKHNFFINKITDVDQRGVAESMLKKILDYADLQTCRRRYLLKYFGENVMAENCQGCDNCLTIKESFDATEVSWKILSAVIRLGERFGCGYIVDVLRGKATKKNRERGHETLSVFGVASDKTATELSQIIDLLISNKILHKSDGDYPILGITGKGRILLSERQKVVLIRAVKEESPIAAATTVRRKMKKGAEEAALAYHKPLFEKLRVLRKRIADEKRVPSFIIFGDVSLREMAFYFPQSSETFEYITGVGRVKLAEYGDAFLSVIRDYAKKENLRDGFLN
jgi:ATP-dependent DNA helicase RecQ